MQKAAPSFGRIAIMAGFALSCFGLLLFLWLSFGGNVPLKAKQYEVEASFQDAATLAENADVRIAGVTVGKVRKKELDKGGAATAATLSIDVMRPAAIVLRTMAAYAMFGMSNSAA